MAIDTGDLTDKTHNAIIIEAERFDHNLTLQFGLLSYECEDEKEFIDKSKILIKAFLKFTNAQIDDLFYGEPPLKKSFHVALHKILDNILKLK